MRRLVNAMTVDAEEQFEASIFDRVLGALVVSGLREPGWRRARKAASRPVPRRIIVASGIDAAFEVLAMSVATDGWPLLGPSLARTVRA